jgi:hypothetical protein
MLVSGDPHDYTQKGSSIKDESSFCVLCKNSAHYVPKVWDGALRAPHAERIT